LLLTAFLWAIAWVGNVPVLGLRTIDDGASAPLLDALAVDALLLALFALHHSLFARPAVKRWAARVLPQPMERSTYVLVASALLLLVLQGWRALPENVWQIEGSARAVFWLLQALGWMLVLVSTFMISHFELFGLKQVWSHWRRIPEKEPAFFVRGLYRLVRHPIMLGFIVAFWATPSMSVGHFLFAGMTTVWIVIALQFEERDLREAFNQRYRDYQREVPMLIPGTKLFADTRKPEERRPAPR